MLNFILTKDSICQKPILHLLMKVLSGRHADTLPSPGSPCPALAGNVTRVRPSPPCHGQLCVTPYNGKCVSGINTTGPLLSNIRNEGNQNNTRTRHAP